MSAGRQVGRWAQFGGLAVGSVGACLRRSLNFKTTVAHKGRRYHQFTVRGTRGAGRGQEIVRSAGRQVGRSANWRVRMSAENFRLTPKRKFFLFTGGRGSCRAVISAGRQVGRSANWRVRMSAENFGSQGCSPSRAENFFGSPEVRPPERKNFFGLLGSSPSRKSRIFVAAKVTPTTLRFGRSLTLPLSAAQGSSPLISQFAFFVLFGACW